VVILPPDPSLACYLKGVRDSKQLAPNQRETAREKILKHASAWAEGFATNEEIDQIGILPATRLAACRALEALPILPIHILLDYLFLPDIPVPQTALIKGDCRSLSIAAASILAKTARDAEMRTLDTRFPGYGLATHKGYGTVAHREAISRLGPSQVHRLSFTLLPIEASQTLPREAGSKEGYLDLQIHER
jgi:ribonuclease HII